MERQRWSGTAEADRAKRRHPKGDANANATGVIPCFIPIALGASDNGYDFTYGLGAGHVVTKNTGAQLQWQRFNNVGNNATPRESGVVLWNLEILSYAPV